MEERTLKDRSFDFSMSAIKIHSHLTEVKNESVMSEKLLRYATVIGEQVEELYMHRDPKMLRRILIVLNRNVKRLAYWTRLLYNSDYIDEESTHSFVKDILLLQRDVNKKFTPKTPEEIMKEKLTNQLYQAVEEERGKE